MEILYNSHHMLTRRYLLQVSKELSYQHDQQIKISLWNKGSKIKVKKLI